MRNYSAAFIVAVIIQIRKNVTKSTKRYLGSLDVHDRIHLVNIAFDEGILMAAAMLESWAAGQTCGPLNDTQARAWCAAEDEARTIKDLERYEDEQS